MFASLDELASSLRQLVTHLDPSGLDAASAVEIVDGFDQIERLAATGKAIAATQVEATQAWRRSGQRDTVGFVAARSGTKRGPVREAMGVASRLSELPLLSQAVRSGTVSLAQAADIAAAAVEHPDTEAELVDLAGRATLRELRARCLEIQARGDGAERQHRRAKAERSCSSQVGRDATWRLNASLTVADGAIVDKVLDHFQTQIFDQARQRGEREPFTAYRADALVLMARAAVEGTCHDGCAIGTEGDADAQPNRRGRRRRSRRSSSLRHAIVISVPHSAFSLNGSRFGGGTCEDASGTCEVPGVGPVPISVVHQLLETDPIIKAIVTKGRDITATATLTRNIKEDLRLAVLASHDLTCGVPTCDNDRFLELDHFLEYGKGGPTDYENLRPLCSFHHDQRTNEGYELRGQKGSYEWVAPDGTVIAAERSAAPV